VNILAINGSRRKKGNTDALIRSVLTPALAAGAQTETVFLGDYAIDACTGCEACCKSWDCVIKDGFSELIEKVDAADGVILASPTYWYSVTSDMKRFVDRCYSLIQFPVCRHQWIGKYMRTGKACITIAVCEQSEVAAMGNTLSLLTDFSRDIGLEVVGSVTGLGFFEAGSVQADSAVLDNAESVGKELLEHMQKG